MVHEPSRPLAPSPKFHLPFQGLSYMALSTLVLDLQVPLSGRVGYFGRLVGSHLGHLVAFVPSGREVLPISCRFVASRSKTSFQLVSSLDVFLSQVSTSVWLVSSDFNVFVQISGTFWELLSSLKTFVFFKSYVIRSSQNGILMPSFFGFVS